jgi:hypothetical protein
MRRCSIFTLMRKGLIITILGSMLLAISVESCFIFKPKNKCGDCPTFKGSPKRR